MIRRFGKPDRVIYEEKIARILFFAEPPEMRFFVTEAISFSSEMHIPHTWCHISWVRVPRPPFEMRHLHMKSPKFWICDTTPNVLNLFWCMQIITCHLSYLYSMYFFFSNNIYLSWSINRGHSQTSWWW